MTLSIHALFVCLIFSQAATLSAQKPQRKTQVRSAEAKDHYRKWLEQDVVYVITEEERAVFLKLSTDDERDQFIEQFWRRRDTDPSNPANEFKEEHYRRIQFANERYHAGIPGWKTDRGRVYVMFGQPDRVESYPAGGSYQRKAYEGGGTTSVYPFEVWEYRYIEGVGTDIELEFVNDSGGNLYRLTMDPQDKDELLRVPGMGLTDSEMLLGSKSFDRVNRIRQGGTAHNQGIYLERAKDQPFERAELLMKIGKAPPIRFKDLKEVVTARVSFNQLPISVATHYFQVDRRSFIVPVTVCFDSPDITFKKEGDIWHSRVQAYGLITNLAGQVVFEFDDEIASDSSSPPTQSLRTYQRKILLAPGKYKLELALKDLATGNVGLRTIGIEIPRAPDHQFSVSAVILTRSIESSRGDLSQPYVVGAYKMTPQVDQIFNSGDPLGFYVEAYRVGLDQATQRPALEIKYATPLRGKEPSTYTAIRSGVTFSGESISIARMIQLNGLKPGKYDFVFSILDTLSGQASTTRAPFEIR